MEWHLSSVEGKKSSPSSELNKNYNRKSRRVILIWGDEVKFLRTCKSKIYDNSTNEGGLMKLSHQKISEQFPKWQNFRRFCENFPTNLW